MTKQVLIRLSLLATLFILSASLSWALLGDPLRGEELFVGTVSFSAGGAPCLACHGISGHELGLAAGANYGPDLTNLFEDYGEEGIAGVLGDLSFESMVAIYANRPLTESEKSDLLAFFGSVSTGTATDIGSNLVLHVILVTAVLMLLIGALGWRRLQGVRQPLVERVRNSKGEGV